MRTCAPAHCDSCLLLTPVLYLCRTWCNASGGCGKDSNQKDVVGGQCQLFTTKSGGPSVYASGNTQPYISGFLAHP